MNNILGKILRIVAIVFMGLTAVMNILGGAGTTCAAFLTQDYPSYLVLVQLNVQWLWQSFVVLTILIGLAGVWSVVQLVRGKSSAYRFAVIVLALGTVVNGIHVFASKQYLGNIMPVVMVFYANLITLVLFLVLGIPGLRERVNFAKSSDSSDNEMAAGLTAIVAGIVTLTTAIWVGPSHMFQGENWVDVLGLPLNIAGTILTLGGFFLVTRVSLQLFSKEVQAVKLKMLGDKQ